MLNGRTFCLFRRFPRRPALFPCPDERTQLLIDAEEKVDALATETAALQRHLAEATGTADSAERRVAELQASGDAWRAAAELNDSDGAARTAVAERARIDRSAALEARLGELEAELREKMDAEAELRASVSSLEGDATAIGAELDEAQAQTVSNS